MESAERTDEAVRGTNCEACGGKVSAVKKGYWKEEPLLRLAAAARVQPQKKPPEINRGYYARVASVRRLVHEFVDHFPSSNVVNLGSGFDALFWSLGERRAKVAAFVEVDFPAVTLKKSIAIRKDPRLEEAVAPLAVGPDGDLASPKYRLVGADMRSLRRTEAKIDALDLDASLPTLLLAECVLVYVEPEACRALLRWAAARFPLSAFVSYEQANLGDRFGRVMLDNLNERGCPLVGAEACMSLRAQNERFLSCGWDDARSWDMQAAWDALPPEERRRVQSIEMLDEGELLVQLLQHYCITVAKRGSGLPRMQIAAET